MRGFFALQSRSVLRSLSKVHMGVHTGVHTRALFEVSRNKQDLFALQTQSVLRPLFKDHTRLYFRIKLSIYLLCRCLESNCASALRVPPLVMSDMEKITTGENVKGRVLCRRDQCSDHSSKLTWGVHMGFKQGSPGTIEISATIRRCTVAPVGISRIFSVYDDDNS
jgi:hypothetical protein